MRMTAFFGKTLREEPAEAETSSHRLLLKSGMIRQVASGVYTYMPLAWRSLRKIEGIIRQEMDAAGSHELRMPALHPLELWESTGRADAMGQTLFGLRDRRDRSLVMAPTHEEVVTQTVKANVHSYRDLPQILYQIQTKFRDEPRPRGGLIRVREFDMKDAYSFDADEEGLDRSYDAMVQAYRNIYRRCGLNAVMAEADSGAIGGKDSHEFLLPAESGEDLLIHCPDCDYAANAERAESVKSPLEHEEPLPLEEIHTPGLKTIEDLGVHLGIPAPKTLKAVFYACDGEVVFVTIRGDLEVKRDQTDAPPGMPGAAPGHAGGGGGGWTGGRLRIVDRTGGHSLNRRRLDTDRRQLRGGGQPARLPPAERLLPARHPAGRDRGHRNGAGRPRLPAVPLAAAGGQGYRGGPRIQARHLL